MSVNMNKPGLHPFIKFYVPTQATVTVPDNLIGDMEGSATGSEISAAPPDANKLVKSVMQPAESVSPAVADKPHASKLELYQGHSGDNEKFVCRDLLPGDSMTKYICVKTNHDADITLFFNTKVTEQTKALGDVLHIKATLLSTDKVLFDASFSEMKDRKFSQLLKKIPDKDSTVYYRIDVSLDTSVGNEYQAAMLQADFTGMSRMRAG